MLPGFLENLSPDNQQRIALLFGFFLFLVIFWVGFFICKKAVFHGLLGHNGTWASIFGSLSFTSIGGFLGIPFKSGEAALLIVAILFFMGITIGFVQQGLGMARASRRHGGGGGSGELHPADPRGPRALLRGQDDYEDDEEPSRGTRRGHIQPGTRRILSDR